VRSWHARLAGEHRRVTELVAQVKSGANFVENPGHVLSMLKIEAAVEAAYDTVVKGKL